MIPSRRRRRSASDERGEHPHYRKMRHYPPPPRFGRAWSDQAAFFTMNISRTAAQRFLRRFSDAGNNRRTLPDFSCSPSSLQHRFRPSGAFSDNDAVGQMNREFKPGVMEPPPRFARSWSDLAAFITMRILRTRAQQIINLFEDEQEIWGSHRSTDNEEEEPPSPSVPSPTSVLDAFEPWGTSSGDYGGEQRLSVAGAAARISHGSWSDSGTRFRNGQELLSHLIDNEGSYFPPPLLPTPLHALINPEIRRRRSHPPSAVGRPPRFARDWSDPAAFITMMIDHLPGVEIASRFLVDYDLSFQPRPTPPAPPPPPVEDFALTFQQIPPTPPPTPPTTVEDYDVWLQQIPSAPPPTPVDDSDLSFQQIPPTLLTPVDDYGVWLQQIPSSPPPSPMTSVDDCDLSFQQIPPTPPPTPVDDSDLSFQQIPPTLLTPVDDYGVWLQQIPSSPMTSVDDCDLSFQQIPPTPPPTAVEDSDLPFLQIPPTPLTPVDDYDAWLQEIPLAPPPTPVDDYDAWLQEIPSAPPPTPVDDSAMSFQQIPPTPLTPVDDYDVWLQQTHSAPPPSPMTPVDDCDLSFQQIPPTPQTPESQRLTHRPGVSRSCPPSPTGPFRALGTSGQSGGPRRYTQGSTTGVARPRFGRDWSDPAAFMTMAMGPVQGEDLVGQFAKGRKRSEEQGEVERGHCSPCRGRDGKFGPRSPDHRGPDDDDGQTPREPP